MAGSLSDLINLDGLTLDITVASSQFFENGKMGSIILLYNVKIIEFHLMLRHP
jgi:hypothetical protein